jgi:hypothetical protein
LVPDESEAAALGLIRQMHGQNASLRAIGEALHAAGHRPKRGDRWHPQTIARIVHRDQDIA